SKVARCLGSLSANVRPKLRNLGVTFDQAMLFDDHIKTVTHSCFFHLKNISKLRSMLTYSELEMIIHAFISSRLDYCNSLFTCLNKTSLDRLQLVQKAAARLLSRSHKFTHITPVLASLHWLPVNFMIQHKILTITYRALHGQAPAYLTDLVSFHCPVRSLRSAEGHLLTVPHTRLKTKGDRAFKAVAPKWWNALPHELRAASSVDIFKKQLKTHLFRLAFH
ncbi:hypothetical protein P7M41_26055, partial [Vibrio parahaemolyticus]|nr:hypothetical protein [Vibrio parahaemolyticus]